VDGFFKRSRGWPFVEAADVAVDKDDSVYVLNRGPCASVMIFDKDGNFPDAWGRIGGRSETGFDFTVPHGISVGPDGSVYTSDTGSGLPDSPSRHPMIKGKVIHEPGPGSFGAPHGIAVDSEGSFYVAEVGETFLRIDRRDRSVQKFVRV
jgi:DNA-binding beta-propeller fold protein YncE|tara:strand:- start:1190 stop:1639 length:450 start_codon:yes stop_codon:yes gene_type:complete